MTNTPSVVSSEEEWRDVLGFEGVYTVSNIGGVKSRGRPLKQFKDTDGYFMVVLRCRPKKRVAKVHALVAEAFIGPRPKGLVINHKNGIKTDNRVENLEYVTQKQNNRHAMDSGLHDTRGEKAHFAKLMPEDVIEIRRLSEAGMSRAAIGRQFGVSGQAITKIVFRKRWGHI